MVESGAIFFYILWACMALGGVVHVIRCTIRYAAKEFAKAFAKAFAEEFDKKKQVWDLEEEQRKVRS